MSEEISAIVSQMNSWDTGEIENSFLSSCVFYLENEKGSPDGLCDLATQVDQDWFAETHKKALFHVIRKIAVDSVKSSLVVPGSIAVMAEKLLVSMGYQDECQYIEEVATSPSMFFSIESLYSVIPLWRVKLARSALKANAEQIVSALTGVPDRKVFEEGIPSLIESQQELWYNASTINKKDDDWESSIEEALSPLPKDIVIPTGLSALDEAIQGGIAKRNSPYSGRLVVIAGRPGMGKSAFAVHLATVLADTYCDVAFFSLEMSKKQVHYRSISCFDYMNLSYQKKLVDPILPHHLRLRSYSAAQRARLESYSTCQMVKRFHIFDASEAINTISAKIKLLSKTRKNLSTVFIDYLQLIEGCSGDAQNTEASNIGNVTRALKKLATSIGIDIFLLSQVNRGVENRNDKMPNMSDLRASGRIEEDSDIVMFLLRPNYYDKEKDKYELAISVAKNRHGECGTLQCCIDLQSSVIFEKHRL
jgi:replicative DNA helicase